MRVRLILAAALATIVLLIFIGATAQAAPGSLRVLIVANIPSNTTDLGTAIAASPGVVTVDTFDSSSGTPTPETLSTYDLVVGTGDSSYDDQALWGDRLADFIDAGGALIQFAYDNWDSSTAHPTGRFESGGYPPFIPGPNDNLDVSLGTILVPGSPLLAGVPSFTTGDNTTPALAPGATLLARWSDDRNAIATKGRVVSVSAAVTDVDPVSAEAQLAVNAGNVLGRHTLAVNKAGRGSGTVASVPAGINCGASCAATFAGATSITLTATATRGSFAGWSSAECGTSPSCTLTPTANTTVTANFGACVVPKVKGKRVKKAKKRLRNNDCRLGKVKNKGRGKVRKQKPKPGAVLPVGSKVNVTLG
jgi:hypothetical protein